MSSQVDYDFGRRQSDKEEIYLASISNSGDSSQNSVNNEQHGFGKKHKKAIIIGIIILFIMFVAIMDNIINVENVSDASKNNVNKTQNVEAKK